jgi:hemerythrin-like domain-containing protein
MLVAEHDHIWMLLDALDSLSRDLTEGRAVSAEFLTRSLDFIVLYADRCHHGKEEDLLFPLLSKKGIPVEGGPIGAMLEEHDQGRALVGSLRDAVGRYAGGNSSSAGEIAEALRSYTALLRQHILKENDVLFPMAEGVLSPEEDLELTRKFEEVDVELLGSEKRRLEEWVRQLSQS